MRESDTRLPVQGFTPSRIETASAGVPFSTDGVLAVRVSINTEYYINTDSANKADMVGGSITVIHYDVSQLVFTADTVLEVMPFDRK